MKSILVLLVACAGLALAQNPSPCLNIVNTAGAGQVLSAVNGGTTTPPCRWINRGGSGGSVSITASGPIVVTPSPITGTGVISCPTCVPTAFSANVGGWCPWTCSYFNQASTVVPATNVVACAEFTAPYGMNLGMVSSQQATDDAGKHFAFAVYSAAGTTLIATSSTITSASNTDFAATFSGLVLTEATTYLLCYSSDSNGVITLYHAGASGGLEGLFYNTIVGHPRVFTAANPSNWSGTTPNFPATLGVRTLANAVGPLLIQFAD